MNVWNELLARQLETVSDHSDAVPPVAAAMTAVVGAWKDGKNHDELAPTLRELARTLQELFVSLEKHAAAAGAAHTAQSVVMQCIDMR